MKSGYLALVNGMAAVENWTVDDSKSADSYVASNTGIGTQRGGGIRTWSGTFEGKGHTPPVMPNEVFVFEGYTAPDTGVEGTDGTVYTGSAICSAVSVTWDWTQNLIQSWSVEFSGKPGLTTPTGSIPLDTTVPVSIGSCPVSVLVDATEVAVPYLTTASLDISATLAEAANSSTVSGGECWTDFLPGPIDWTLALDQEDYDRSGVLAGNADLGAVTPIKIMVADPDYWGLHFGVMMDYTNLTCDRSGQIISRTQNYAMTASDGTTPIGYLSRPGEDVVNGPVWWGKETGP